MLQINEYDNDDEYIYQYIEKLYENENKENYEGNEKYENIILETPIDIIKEKKNIIKIDKEPQPLYRKQEAKTNYISHMELFPKKSSSKKQKNLGRKKKYSNEKGKHTKYCEDNIIRKIKAGVLNIIYIFINNYIYKLYRGDLGQSIFKKELKRVNQKQIIEDKHNKEFINKTLKDIFSEDISSKYSSFQRDHNKKLIEFLLNENNFEIRVKFNKIFSLTFFDCLKHLRKNKYIEELEGLASLDKLYEKFSGDEEYASLFHYYIINFEKIIMAKKNRNRKSYRRH